MKKKYQKLETKMGNFLLREGFHLYNPDVRRSSKRRKSFWSLLLFLGLGTLLCVFCYSSYFPSSTGVVWISSSSSLSTNHVPLRRKSPHELGHQQSAMGSFKLKSLWKKLFSNSGSVSSQEMDANALEEVKRNGKERTMEMARGESGGESQACNFPRLNPFDPSIKEFIKEPANVDCFSKHPLIFRTNFRNKLIQIKMIENATCCYKTISRGNGSDHNIKYSKQCHPILKSNTDLASTAEFISVKCSGNIPRNTTTAKSSTIILHKDIFAFVPIKPSVESRIKIFEDSKKHTNKLRKSAGSHYLQDSLYNEEQKDRLSLLILGLDAQSHMNFIRQMPLTYSFLLKNLSAIGLHGYTKVGDNTFPNVVPFLSGLSVSELRKKCWPTKLSYFDGCPWIWKDFARSGYRTSFAEDSIWMGTFHYEKKGFLSPPTDYYFHPISLLMAKKIGHETWGNAKLCYGPRLAFEVLLDYIVKTAVTFSPNNLLYFQYVWANSLFHDYLNNPKLGDELLYLTLEYLSREGHLNKTGLILVSDHGMRWGSIRSTYQGKIEERMPAAYFAFPEWWRDKYSTAWANLGENAGRLSTPFDVHETLRDLLDLRGISNKQLQLDPQSDVVSGGSSGGSRIVPRGISLFRNVPMKRTCKMAGIEEHWCVCNSMKEVAKGSALVQSAALFIVKRINEELEKFTEFCALLSLFKVNDAMRKIDGDVDLGAELDLDHLAHQGDGSKNHYSTLSENTYKAPLPFGGMGNKTEGISIKNDTTRKDIVQLQITLVTKPSDAVFEATVYGSVNDGGHLHSWKLSGDISRLNLYREQSLCIQDYVVQKYCYCLDQMENSQEQ